MASDSTFDPNTFIATNIDAPMATSVRLVPEGEYDAFVGDIGADNFEKFDFEYKKGKRMGQSGSMYKFSVPFILQNEAVRIELARETLMCNQELNLDVDSMTGQLDFGPDKNVGLGRLREATGQNVPGPWNPTMLAGAGPVVVRVQHKTIKPNNGEPYLKAEVTRVTRKA